LTSLSNLKVSSQYILGTTVKSVGQIFYNVDDSIALCVTNDDVSF